MIEEQRSEYDNKALWHYQSMSTQECFYVLVGQAHSVEEIPKV